MSRKERRVLTEQELKLLGELSGVRLPMAKIAGILNMAETELKTYIKKNPAARRRVEDGRNLASANVYQTGYRMATSGRHPAMTIFWLKTQEGFREVDRMELTGKDGAPLAITEKPREEVEAILEKQLRLLEALKSLEK